MERNDGEKLLITYVKKNILKEIDIIANGLRRIQIDNIDAIYLIFFSSTNVK